MGSWKSHMSMWRKKTDHDESVPTGNSGISSGVLRLEQNYKAMKFLAGEMIATLIILDNKKLFDHMPPKWFFAVDNWEKKYKEIRNG